MATFRDTVAEIVAFRETRDWGQFHTPRNLAAAIAIEASELQETMLWKTDEEIQAMLDDDAGRGEVEREVADVLIFALLLCHQAGIDPAAAIGEKLAENAKKYPVQLAKGNATKYTRLGREGT